MLTGEPKHCQLCGDTYELTKHHQLWPKSHYQNDKRRDLPEFITILCRTCHEMYHWAVDNRYKKRGKK